MANRLGDEGSGFRSLVTKLPQERLSIAVTGVAAARQALDVTLDYVKERTAFGQPIGSFQNSRFRLAEMATEVEIAQTFVDRCVLALNDGALTAEEAAMAKWWCTELQKRVVDTCVQLHGGYGYMAEYPIARAYADARITTIYGGTTEIMKEIIGTVPRRLRMRGVDTRSQHRLRRRTEGAEGDWARADHSHVTRPPRDLARHAPTPHPSPHACSPSSRGAAARPRSPPRPPAAAAAVVKPIVFPVDGTGHLHRHLRRLPRRLPHPRGPGPHGREDAARCSPPSTARCTASCSTTRPPAATRSRSRRADGWTYHYIHVNNDTPGTDDGQGHPRPGLPGRHRRRAPPVTKGQVVAYMGDSGNAESAGSHLHFEIRQPAAAGHLHRARRSTRTQSLQAAPRVCERDAALGPAPHRRPAGRRRARSPTGSRPATVACSATGTATASTSP